MTVGQRMRELRTAANLSQAEIAALCGAGQTSITRIEAGKVSPSIKLLVWWADYFDVSLDYLCGRTDQKQGKLYECKPPVKVNKEEMQQFIEMCLNPNSPYNSKLKDALFSMLEEAQK